MSLEKNLLRIENLRKDGTCDPKRVFSPGREGYCRYYGLGTVESGCPKTCKYAIEQMKAKEDAEAHRAMEEEVKKGGRLRIYVQNLKTRFASQ